MTIKSKVLARRRISFQRRQTIGRSPASPRPWKLRSWRKSSQYQKNVVKSKHDFRIKQQLSRNSQRWKLRLPSCEIESESKTAQSINSRRSRRLKETWIPTCERTLANCKWLRLKRTHRCRIWVSPSARSHWEVDRKAHHLHKSGVWCQVSRMEDDEDAWGFLNAV